MLNTFDQNIFFHLHILLQFETCIASLIYYEKRVPLFTIIVRMPKFPSELKLKFECSFKSAPFYLARTSRD